MKSVVEAFPPPPIRLSAVFWVVVAVFVAADFTDSVRFPAFDVTFVVSSSLVAANSVASAPLLQAALAVWVDVCSVVVRSAFGERACLSSSAPSSPSTRHRRGHFQSLFLLLLLLLSSVVVVSGTAFEYPPIHHKISIYFADT